MQDKVIVITGANSGIGYETAKALAEQGAQVVMACRDAPRGEAALQDLKQAVSQANVQLMSLDLSSFESIRAFAKSFQAQFKQLDVLVNNAGLFPMTEQKTREGFEMQFGVNHLGHFLLTHLLLPELKASGSARVVNVASMIHQIGKIDFDSFKGEKDYKPLTAYGQSKLANVLFSRELAKRYAGDGISSFSLHPGGVGTNIAGRGCLRKNFYRIFGGHMTPKRGAQTSIYLATEPGIEPHSGSYFGQSSNIKKSSKRGQDMAMAKRFWDESEQLTEIHA
jgi:NAD(P)-dependent dehydrogenase (short-subunit alcohol dehydrogenase family)